MLTLLYTLNSNIYALCPILLQYSSHCEFCWSCTCNMLILFTSNLIKYDLQSYGFSAKLSCLILTTSHFHVDFRIIFCNSANTVRIFLVFSSCVNWNKIDIFITLSCYLCHITLWIQIFFCALSSFQIFHLSFFFHFYWEIIDIQYCISSRCTA